MSEHQLTTWKHLYSDPERRSNGKSLKLAGRRSECEPYYCAICEKKWMSLGLVFPIFKNNNKKTPQNTENKTQKSKFWIYFSAEKWYCSVSPLPKPSQMCGIWIMYFPTTVGAAESQTMEISSTNRNICNSPVDALKTLSVYKWW